MGTLEESLFAACEDQLDGSPWGALLAGRMERACQQVLQRAGKRGRVHVLHGGQRVHVELRDGPRVRTVRVDLASGV